MVFITGRNEVVAKVIFLHLSVILFTGGGLPQWMLGYHPPEQTPPGSRPPREQTPPHSLPPGSRLQHTVYERPVRILLECIPCSFNIYRPQPNSSPLCSFSCMQLMGEKIPFGVKLIKTSPVRSPRFPPDVSAGVCTAVNVSVIFCIRIMYQLQKIAKFQVCCWNTKNGTVFLCLVQEHMCCEYIIDLPNLLSISAHDLNWFSYRR